ncbi:adenylyltransferase/cytidyltransferase family protein [Candidatus Stoquefichus massiliensis]|uniref:adenylyltransferase/cytidyltransferase family protein n=1 Tax=Candidatus Stoquefichus massiliensis TaxID=1470350 RepID=UPI000485F8C3|nr:adenylyltransferase/cytidyltransferase family protein [Candidatus Stoquefichus massiliensis]
MKKVITYGTFDLFHQGHYNILKRAKTLGDYLIVGVTGENYDAERGKLSVQDSLPERIENVRKTGFADQIIVEEYDGQKINDIISYGVDTLVLGLDWKGKFDHLKKYCDVVYLERTKNISSTQLRQEKNTIFNYGIVTDNILENDFIFDAEYVSGIHIESIYSQDERISKTICENLHISYEFNDYKQFLSTVDIVYVGCKLEDRYEYIKEALINGKHVISDSPMSLDTQKVEKLYALADEHKLILLDNIPTVYVKTFNQLLSIANSHVIGEIVNVKCSLPLEELSMYYPRSTYDAMYFIICILTKILGRDYQKALMKTIKNNDKIIYQKIEFDYENSVAYGELTQSIQSDSHMELVGTNGRIVVPNLWWNANYFKVITNDTNNVRRYSTNFEGNGFRYLMQVMMQMIKDKKIESLRLSGNDSVEIIKLLTKI